jgi:transposase-like protein
LTPKKRFEHDVKLNLKANLEEKMSDHLEAGYRELTSTRRGERNGHYPRNLLPPQAR